jgi:hypothetical protein
MKSVIVTVSVSKSRIATPHHYFFQFLSSSSLAHHHHPFFLFLFSLLPFHLLAAFIQLKISSLPYLGSYIASNAILHFSASFFFLLLLEAPCLLLLASFTILPIHRAAADL